MTCAEIKALPKEFDFKSNINPCGLTYHAVEKEYYYIVTTDGCEWKIDKKAVYRHLLKDDYVVCKANKTMRTEKEIRDKLAQALKNLNYIKEDYNKYIGTLYADKYIPDICYAWTEAETKVGVLRWVLGEDK